jgi:hypothetical protein
VPRECDARAAAQAQIFEGRSLMLIKYLISIRFFGILSDIHKTVVFELLVDCWRLIISGEEGDFFHGCDFNRFNR